MNEKNRPDPDCPVGDPSACPIPHERRRADDHWRAEVATRMDAFEKRLAENTTLTQAIKSNTDEIVQFFQTGKGFFRFASWVGIGAKWLATVAAGREDATTGAMCQGIMLATSNLLKIYKYDNTYPGATGYIIAMSGRTYVA